MSVADTLKQRHNIHGDYAEQSLMSMNLLTVMQQSTKYHRMSAAQKEALILIAVKIGRILMGDANAADHWHDIAGYAQLVENILNGKQANGVEGAVGTQIGGVQIAGLVGAHRAYDGPPGRATQGQTSANWGKGQILAEGEAQCQKYPATPRGSSEPGAPWHS